MYRNLFEELTTVQTHAIASLLGFNLTGADKKVYTGFRNRLRDIPAFNRTFTIGEALDKYLNHIQNRQSRLG